MAKRNPVPLNTGVGRFIGGSCYTGSTTDDKGQLKVYKTGAKAGQPRTDYSVGIAIKKTQPHWGTEPGWGAAIWAEGHAAWPGGQAQRKDFAWKIIDGDSTEPNKKMKRPCDQVGYPGHWILWFGGTTPPPVAVAIGGAQPTWNDQPGTCMPGDYIEIRGSVSSNESDQTAGMYLNIDAVCLRAYHAEGRIATQQIDLATAGFGATALPSDAVTAPAGNALPPAAPPAPGAAPSTPAAPPVPASPAVAPAAPPAPVTPNAAILGAPAPVAVPPAPAPSPAVTPPPAPAVRVLKNGWVYDDAIKVGWTDDSLRAAGHLD
jgi:hypothetical protein